MGELKLGILFPFNIHHSRASFQNDPFLYFHVLNTSMASCLLKYMWTVMYFGRKFRSRQDHTYVCNSYLTFVLTYFMWIHQLSFVCFCILKTTYLFFVNKYYHQAYLQFSMMLFSLSLVMPTLLFILGRMIKRYTGKERCSVFYGKRFFPVPEMFDDTKYAQVDSS